MMNSRLKVTAITFLVSVAAGSMMDTAWPFSSAAVSSVVFKNGFEAEGSAVDLAKPGNFIVSLGESLDFTLSATTTLPGGVLQYDRVAGPTGLNIDPATGRVQWTPTSNDLGVNAVTASARDQLNPPDAEAFQVEVVQPPGPAGLDNRPPSLAPLPDASVNVGDTFSVQASGSDPENGALTYTLVSAPEGMSIDGQSGLISFTPELSQAGEQIIGVRVVDPLDLSATQNFTLNVVRPNRPPVALDDGYELQRNDVLTVSSPGVLVNDSDPDGDSLTVSLVSDVQFGTLDLASDGAFTYTPDDPVGDIGFVDGGSVDAPSGTGPTGPPLIADMNDDGVTDVFTQLGNGVAGLNVFFISSPSTGEVVATSPQLDRGIINGSGKALADIDLDGFVEIISIGGENSAPVPSMYKIIAFEHDGTFKWESEQLAEEYRVDGKRFSFGDGNLDGAEPTIADLDQDGTPEIIVAHSLISVDPNLNGIGVTAFDNQGLKLFTAYARGIPQGSTFFRVEVVDLDLDGDLEILAGSAAFSHTGEVLWALPGLQNANRRATPIAANLDGDPFPELVRVGSNVSETIALNHDGTELWRIPSVFDFNTFSTELVIADVDDDGPVEILAVGNNGFSPARLEVFNGLDGSLKWEYPSDGSGLNLGVTAPTVFDLDGDGDSEVLLFGFQPRILYVLDGSDGRLIEQFDLELGNTPTFEIPIFADVDSDGASELVLSGTGRFSPALSTAYWVFESPGDDWAPTRPIWNQWNYHVTNVNEDGTIPQFEEPHWLVPGLNQNRINNRLAEERDDILDQFTYRVSDGELQDEAVAFLTVLPGAKPRIVSTPDTTGTVGFPYLYAPQVFDPDAGERFTFRLESGPPGMTIDGVTGLVRWTPEATDSVEVGIIVADATSLTDLQTFTLTVGESVTVPDVVGLQQAAATTALQGANLEPGLVREVFDANVAAGTVASQSPPAGAIAEFGQAIDLQVSLGVPPEDTDDDGDGFTDREGDCDDDNAAIFPGASDAEGDDVDQNCDGVDGVLALTAITLTPAESIVLSNRIIDYDAVGTRADGTAINLNGLGVFSSSDTAVAQLLGDRRVRSAVPGTATISLSHQGVTGQATITVVGGVSLDDTPPTAAITSPVSAQEVTAPIEVIGTADDENLLRWELLTSAGDEDEAVLLNSATTSVTDGVLGELDPTLLINGVQTLILRVFDRGENVSEARVNVTVEDNYKVGNFTLTYEDLNVPLASLPITVNRTYDSREKRRGDFGIGWDLGLRTLEVRTNRVLGTGWEVLGGGFGFQLNPTDDHLVTLTLPDGDVETFALQITPESSFLVPFIFVTARLEPVGDTVGELTLLDNPFLAILDGQPGPVQLLDDSSFDVFDPQRFRYVARNGLEFVVSRSDGLESFTDVNGNTLTFSNDAITHSDGTAVQFVRDGLGRITRLTDPTGNEQSYQYDSSGNLAAHTDAEGNMTRFRYDRRSNLLEVIDPLGNRSVRNEYDDDGRLIAVVDAEGHRVEFTHDVDGREQLIRDANGNIQRLLLDDSGNVRVRERTVTVDGLPSVAVERFEYDERGNMLVEVDADGIRSEMTWDENDNLLQTVIDPGGLNLTTVNSYDERNNRLTQSDPLGQLTSYTYDKDDNVLTITDPLGGITRFGYTGDGRLATRTDPLGTVTSFIYDDAGQLIQEDVNESDGTLLSRNTYTYDASARRLSESTYRIINGVLTPLTTTYVYDSNGRQVSMTDPLGNVTRTEYDGNGNVAAVIDALGRRTEHSYDGRGKRIGTTYPDGTTTSTVYDPAGNVIARTDELGRVTRYEYDELNRKVATIHPDGAREEQVLSEGGQTMARIDANGNRTDFTYDSANRQLDLIAPQVVDGRNGSTVRPTLSQSYDAAGRVTATTDANGNTTSYVYDALGRQVRIDHADGTSTSQAYDAAGRLTSMTDELGRTTNYDYDGLGRLISVTEPAPEAGQPRPVTTYTWDLTGNRLSQTDALGRTTRFQYDALGRQVARVLPGSQVASVEYDAVGNVVVQTDFNGDSVVFVYDERNRLIERGLPDGDFHRFTYSPTGTRLTSRNANSAQTFTYDQRDRLVGLTQADGSSLSYQFDAAGNLLRTATPSQSTDYSYDAMNRMLTSTTAAEQTVYGYDPNGNQVRLIRPNLSETVNTFDSRNRVLSIEHVDSTGAVLESFVNSYRDNGQRASVTESDGSTETYSYDDLNRLVLEIRTGAVPRSIEYRYDLVGNRIGVIQDGGVLSSTYDQNDRLLSDGTRRFTYDANGNRVSVTDGGSIQRMSWNGLNWLTSIEQATGSTDYLYNADAERIAVERDTGSVERYLVDPQNSTGFSQVKETRDAQGTVVEQYRYGSDLLSRDDADEGLRYFHTDALGSTRLLTDTSSQATDRYSYTGYGMLADASGGSDNAYLYAGERRQEETGDYYLRARYYDPSLGQFLSRDPFMGLERQPVTMRPYLYASLDPINNIDPLGLFTIAEVQVSSYIQAVGRKAQTTAQFCTALKKAQVAADAISFVAQITNLAITQGFGSSGGSARWNFELDLPKSFGEEAKFVASYLQTSLSPFEAGGELSITTGGVVGVSGGVAFQYQDSRWKVTPNFAPFIDLPIASVTACGITLAEIGMLYTPIGLQAGSAGGPGPLGLTAAGNVELKLTLFRTDSRFSFVAWDLGGVSVFGYPIE